MDVGDIWRRVIHFCVRSIKRFAQCNKISRVGLHNNRKKRQQNKTWGKMMKMRRRNCYADVITKAEGETDRPHYG